MEAHEFVKRQSFEGYQCESDIPLEIQKIKNIYKNIYRKNILCHEKNINSIAAYLRHTEKQVYQTTEKFGGFGPPTPSIIERSLSYKLSFFRNRSDKR